MPGSLLAGELLGGGEAEIPFDTLITSLGIRRRIGLGDAVQAGNICAALESDFSIKQKIKFRRFSL